MSPVRRPDVESSNFAKRLNLRIRHAIGLTQEPPPMCEDPELSYMPVDAVARLVHGDLSTMIIGGLGSLFLQMLHPYAMAGGGPPPPFPQQTTRRALAS